MDWMLQSQQLLVVIIIPLMFVTARTAIKNWSSLWDKEITPKDRDTLLRIAMFWLFPVVVFFHELGHAAATVYFGGKVQEFHYALLSGYVVPSGFFTPEQILIIFLAGNVVEIILGFISLLLALVVSSPPLVALLVYLGLWSIAGTAILYTTMSLVGLYGDWTAIYSSPVHSWVAVIGIVHVLVVALIIYLVYGRGPRLWFTNKTRPQWARRRNEALQSIQREPSTSKYVSLAWLYYEVNLDDFAHLMLDKSLELEPDALEPQLLRGWLYMNKAKYIKAESAFMQVVKSDRAPSVLRARAFMAIGHCQLVISARARAAPEEGLREALQAYTEASTADQYLADPRFHKAVTLNKLGLYKEAEAELRSLENLRWLDSSLKERVPAEIAIATKNQAIAQ